MSGDYRELVARSIVRAERVGLTGPFDLPAAMRTHQVAATTFALEQGRAALFLDTGLGKSLCAFAWAATLQAGARVEGDGAIPLTVTFCAPDNRRRDMDNAIASGKAYFDGIADALGVNDRRFEPTYRWGEVVKGGCVTVTL